MGELEEPMEETSFLHFVKEKMQAEGIRHSAFLGRPIKKVAVLGGAGSFAISQAIQAGADAYLTADLKYHQFYEAENRILLADIGHFESEQFTKELFYEIVIKKFPTFALRLSDVKTNPIFYFC